MTQETDTWTGRVEKTKTGSIINANTGETISVEYPTDLIPYEEPKKLAVIEKYVNAKMSKELKAHPEWEGMTIGQILIATTGLTYLQQARLHSEYTGVLPKTIDAYINSSVAIRGVLIEEHEEYEAKDGSEGAPYNYMLMLTDDVQEVKIDGVKKEVRTVIRTSANQPIKLMLGFARAFGWGVWEEPISISFTGSKADGYFARLME
jgi:hypothetical protein